MSRKRKKTQRIRRRQNTSNQRRKLGGFGYVEIPSPFAGLSREGRARHAESVAVEASDRFGRGLKDLRSRITAYEPTSLLAHLAFFHLSSWGKSASELAGEHTILQHHVEIVQALALQHSADEFPWMPTFPDIQGFLGLLDDTSMAYVFRRLMPNVSQEERSGAFLLERMRMNTQAVRNWGYPDQISRIIVELFRPLDDRIMLESGLRIGDLYGMCLRLIELSEERMTAHYDRLAKIAQAKTIDDVFHANHNDSESHVGTVDETHRLFALLVPTLTLEQAKEFFVHHLNLSLPNVFTFSLQDCRRAYPSEVEDDVLHSVLESWSMAYGDLAGDDAERFFLGNPVWSKPFIRLEDDKYFCPIPVLFLSFGLELMEHIVRTRTSLTSSYEKRRAGFLEDEIFRLFSEAFPSAQPWRGSRWANGDDASKVYENDLLVRVDTAIFIVEAKAGKVSAPTRRGAEQSLRYDINKLIAAPAMQATRFGKFLRANPGPHRLASKYGSNDIDVQGVQQMVQLAVTLDRVGDFYSRSADLHAAGLLDSSLVRALTLTLPDLESIFDLLDGQCQKAHYLVRRLELERNVDYLGGEIDLLDFYIDTGFAIGSLARPSILLLGGRASNLDPYFMRHATGAHPPRPQLRLTQWWQDILGRVEDRKMAGWMELGMALLNVPSDDQRNLEERFRTTRQNVLEHGHTPQHEDALYLTSGTLENREAVATLAYRSLTREERNELVERVGYRAMELAGSDRSVVIAVDVVREDYPYSAIFLTMNDKLRGDGRDSSES